LGEQNDIFMFEAWNVAKGRKVQGGRILSQGTVANDMTMNDKELAWWQKQMAKIIRLE
jgi:hypothetical protein